MIRVEMLIQVCINGRPIWRKARVMKNELSIQMSDKEYDQVLIAGMKELSAQADQFRAKAGKKEAAAK